MEAPASRRVIAPPGKPFSGRLPSQRASWLVWVVPAAAAHVVLLVVLLSDPAATVRPDRPLPTWAIALSPPLPDESYTIRLPPPRVLSEPVPARAPQRGVPLVRAPVLGPRAAAPGAPAAAGAGVPARPAPPGPAAGPGPGPRRTAAERLRPEHRDPRLWTPLPEEIVGLSEAQRAQLELDVAIREIADSMTVLAEAGRRATDWTYTDAQGRRWGIAPGSHGMVNLHLGGITIPLPFGFSAPRTADAARRSSQDAEIASQAGRAEAAASRRDRAAEIRRRRDADRTRERAAARPDTVGGA